MNKGYQCEVRPLAYPGNTIDGKHYRITVITERLFRFEYSKTDRFEDRASQVVWFRDLGEVPYTKEKKGAFLEIRTEFVRIRYDETEFSETGLTAKIEKNAKTCGLEWFYGKKVSNLGGTARTLDMMDGEVGLDQGILSQEGFSVLCDSNTMMLDGNGWVGERKDENIDFYLFAYGHEYQDALRDFYRITGNTPMIPRYALGNWWSRYYEYSEESYKKLIQRFEREKLPFSVAVIDMDWHLVDIDSKYGDGWTGYTWNRKLFPDPRRFMEWLHNRGMKVTLNVHPALGIRAHEEMYTQIAEAMGIDPKSEEPVEFDITDPEFLESYFKIVHHPHEADGVDFWWIDWQQGMHTRMKGMDPLWMLNHYHYLDSARDGKRPMTFSRYAGPGSHRYPIGFSGDTVISWASLRFQPYFTYTASNIGYGWWSHDIGGHMLGEKSDVMEIRWLQFGVFSPINRLHSTKCEFSGKEPWNFRPEVRSAMGDFLRLRHKLVPYIYTMNYLAYKEYQPLLRPMYYEYPDCPNAYPMPQFTEDGYPNQYLFGTEMVVAPIVSDLIPSVYMGKVSVWIPDGYYHDFFTGLIYQGTKCIELYRDLSSIPVLIKAGGIVPLTEEIWGGEVDQNPRTLEIRIYGGADGRFTLYEDDGCSNAYQEDVCAKTDMIFSWDEAEFVIEGTRGNTELIPKERNYIIKFMGVRSNLTEVTVKGVKRMVHSSYDERMGCVLVKLPSVSSRERVVIKFGHQLELNHNQENSRVYDILNRAQIDNSAKEKAYRIYKQYQDAGTVLSGMRTIGLDADVLGAVEEVLTAALG